MDPERVCVRLRVQGPKEDLRMKPRGTGPDECLSVVA